MKKIFTFLVAFLAIAGNAVWGQDSKLSFEPSSAASYADGVWTITQDVVISSTGKTEERLKIEGGTESKPLSVSLNGINISHESSSAIIIDGNVEFILSENATNKIVAETTSRAPSISLQKGSSLTISGKGSLDISSKYNSIDVTESTINILEGEINLLSQYKGCIVGNNSEINISGGIIVANISSGGQVVIGSSDESAKLMISGGLISINSVSNSGNTHSDIVKGASLNTGEKGSAFIAIDEIKKMISIKDKSNIDKWQIIILDDWNPYTEISEGYMYGEVSLANDITLTPKHSVIITPKSGLTLNGYKFVNEGKVYLSYEKESLKNDIENKGSYYYQVFYDTKGLEIPEELILNFTKYIDSDDKVEEKGMYYETNDKFFFAKSGEAVTLKWKESTSISIPIQNGWVLKSFKAKKTANGEEIPVENCTFTMPDESITITDIVLEKRSYKIDTCGNLPEGFEVHFENASGETITQSVWGEEIYVIISAPGYDNYTVEEVKYRNDITSNSPKKEITAVDGIYKFEMPKMDTKVSVKGEAKKQLTYTVTVDKNIQHGKISYKCGEGVDAEKIHYKDKIIVNIDEIEDGYGLESLKYIYNDGETQKEGEITYDESAKEYSFLMPAANVTITAVFSEIKYTVSVSEDIENGTVIVMDENEIQVNEFVPGSKVVLNPIPEEGFIPGELSYTYMEGGEEKTVSISGVSFPMPESDVTIHATFVLDPTIDDDDESSSIPQKRYRLYLADQDFYLNDEYDEAGLVLYSRHDKKYTDVGGSFTVWFEKNGEVNEGARVFISNRANGEYKEVKLDEVSGYYQIRNVQSNIYVKLYTEEGFPVANESIEATDARAYAQANKIVVITPEPTDVQIISMAGAVVATAQVAGQQEFANLTEGVYIVRMGDSIVKLQVRN